MFDPKSRDAHLPLWVMGMSTIRELREFEGSRPPGVSLDKNTRMLNGTFPQRVKLLGVFRALVHIGAADVAGGLWLYLMQQWGPEPDGDEQVSLETFIFSFHTSRQLNELLANLDVDSWRLLYLMVMKGDDRHAHMLDLKTNTSPAVWLTFAAELRQQPILSKVMLPA